MGSSVKHPAQSIKPRRRNHFLQRVMNLWNSLPHSTVESESLNGFKREIDIFLIKKRKEGYGEQVVRWI